ncbi:MAG: aminotransferase class I/II-fold pyridoxal phosphate-dependent enzyme, partial [Sphingomicrobium sp.]
MSSDTPSRTPKPSPTKIGNHQLKPATLMMGYGFDPALSEGSLKPPVFLTSTFVFDRAADGKHFFEGITGKRPGGTSGLVYSRFNNPNLQILEDRLCLWEDAEAALAFSSGMTAITTLFLTFVRPGDVIVHSGPLYAATESIIAKILSQFGIQYVDFPAGATRDEMDAVIARAKDMGRVSLIYLESPANPTNALVDVEAMRDARAAAFPAGELPPIAIDNTFLGPLWARPLAQGADISVYSLTKYAGGHSDLVAGGLTGSKALLDKVRMIRNTMGGALDPNT